MSLTEKMANGVLFMTAPNIDAPHAFTTRFGGVSRGIYESLNLSVNLGDDPGCVRENYGRICGALDISDSDIVCSRQVHGTVVRAVGRADRGMLFTTARLEADGLATCEAGVTLAVFTADCTPILLYDPVRKAVAAVHAGWRGTVADIAGEAVRRMAAEFGCRPADIRAAIGPCISVCCYETGPDVPDALHRTLGAEADNCITPFGAKFRVDLKNANRLLLVRAGLSDIIVSDECTACRSDKFWSHRATKGKRGSQAAFIRI